MDNVNAFCDQVSDNIINHLLEPKQIRSYVKQQKIKKFTEEEATQLREKAFARFQTDVRNKISASCNSFNLQEKFDALRKLKREQRSNLEGWRPSLDPERDMVAGRIKILKEESEKLEELRNKLAEELVCFNTLFYIVQNLVLG